MCAVTDTPDEVVRILRAKLKEKSGQERLYMGFGMFDFARQMVLVSHGGLSSAERRGALFLRFYGRDFDEATRKKILAHLSCL
jgi:hypothetical protein